MSVATGEITATLAEWVATVPGEAIPEDVREAARWLILDHLACAIGGAALTPASIMLALYGEQGGTPQATVYATGAQTSLLNATFLNCALSNLLDFDDSYPGAGHPGGTAISPGVAVAEWRDDTLGALLDAVVLAYEVMLRVGLALRPSTERYRQVSGYSTWQTIGAVVAASRLLGLSAEQLRHAFGLGLFNAPVPNMRKLGLEPDERPFSWTKNNYGWAAQGGLLGALLAAKGFLGSRSIFDSERGFWVMAGSDRWDAPQVVADLGASWLVPQTGFKPYASCRWTHTALDAVRALQAQRPDLAPDDLTALRLETFYEVARNLATADPTDIIDAQFAVRHVMALELLGRSARFGLTEADLSDPAVVDLRQRIQVVEAPDLSQRYFSHREMPARLTAQTRDGELHVVTVDVLPGSPANPISRADILAKYRSLTEPRIGPDAAGRLADFIIAADEAAPVGQALRSILSRTRDQEYASWNA